MGNQQTDVNGVSSTPNGVNPASGSGNNSLSLDTMIDGKPVKNIIAEMARKASKEEIERLREEQEDHIDAIVQERLKGLSNQNNGDDPVKKIMSDPKFDPWLKVNQKISQETVKGYSSEQNQADALEWVEDKALELGVDPKQFEAEMFQIIKGRWNDLRATRRVKMAFQEWNKLKETQKKLQEFEDFKKKNPLGGESGGQRVSTKSITLKEELEEAKKSGDWSNYLKRVHEAQETERAKA